MASKRAQRRRACEGKKAYDDPKDAWACATYNSRTSGEHFRVYRCPHCKKLHIGHGKEVYE